MDGSWARVETIHAEVLFRPRSWPGVELVPRRGLKRKTAGFVTFGDPRFIRLDLGRLRDSAPVEPAPLSDPKFWQEVRQLAFAFKEGDWPAIARFYAAYGALGYPWQPVMAAEPWGWAEAALDWFRELTSLVDAINNERYGYLREQFGAPRTITALEATEPIYLVRPKSPFDGHTYSLRYVHLLPDEDDGREWQILGEEEELRQAAWHVVIEGVTTELAEVVLAPISQEARGRKTPIVQWGFKPNGAFQAAFLQWFFEKVAPVGRVTCAAVGCERLVLPPRIRYCSKACLDRQKNRDYRVARKRRGAGEPRGR